MKIKVWVLSTCCPGEGQPCFPLVYGSEAEAEAGGEDQMRKEWAEAEVTSADDANLPADYPGDWREAQRQLIEWFSGCDERWGQWEITGPHEVEVTT